MNVEKTMASDQDDTRPNALRGDGVALVVDLDNTLIRGDVAIEALVRGIRRVAVLLAILRCLLAGPAAIKTVLARRVPVDAARLSYREEVLGVIAAARGAGRPVILATAAHWRTARRVAAVVGPFDAIIASSRRHNRKGAAKLAAIRALLDGRTFDYVGDSSADRPLWQAARTAYTVGIDTGVSGQVRLAAASGTLRMLAKAARPHQWAKNILVLVPLITSGQLTEPVQIARGLVAFVCLSLIASSIYLVNDVLDIDADRGHARKRYRPIAWGALTIPTALAAAVVGVSLGLALGGILLGPASLVALAGYCGLTLAYSIRLKAAIIADVLTLACLYTIRIIVGIAAIMVPVSFWLLLFSIFLFLSLGYLKRYVELRGSTRAAHELLSGRGYIPSDEGIVAMNGVAAGMVSILVLALFAEAMARGNSYASPALLWLLPLPLLYWLNRIWMMGRRGEVDSDPVAFALTDRTSLAVGAILAAILLAAKFIPFRAIV
ncbi:UbiA family prenyltransferase [Sphingomonas sp. Leaf34]|uniref:UbiA family prenyltransferase n=1 Tax=Sphingomonas sp. Leaf34 TaxID=1736216 RepID=UPI00138EEBC4|nr:UbiA family prenyltransferase [Sphingomonas sp. Leaf34]